MMLKQEYLPLYLYLSLYPSTIVIHYVPIVPCSKYKMHWHPIESKTAAFQTLALALNYFPNNRIAGLTAHKTVCVTVRGRIQRETVFFTTDVIENAVVPGFDNLRNLNC